MEAREGYIEGLLRQLGFERIRPRKNGFTALCRFHKDRAPSFSISDEGLWMCWSCGVKGNLKQLIDRLGNGALNWRDELKMAGILLEKKMEPQRKRNNAIGLPKDFKPYGSEADVPQQVATRLEWKTISAFGLGSCSRYPNAGRCVIPIRHKGRIVGYHGRALKDDVMPRYYNAEFDIKDHVFNFDGGKRGHELIVVEGAFDAMSMHEKGFPCTVATFGVKFTPAQVARILSVAPSSVTVCYDRDKDTRAGQKAAMLLGAALTDYVSVDIMPLPFDQDPNECAVDLLWECYKRRRPLREMAKL